jgi:hypothetical protein
MGAEKADEDHPSAAYSQYQSEHNQKPRDKITHCRYVLRGDPIQAIRKLST